MPLLCSYSVVEVSVDAQTLSHGATSQVRASAATLTLASLGAPAAPRLLPLILLKHRFPWLPAQLPDLVLRVLGLGGCCTSR